VISVTLQTDDAQVRQDVPLADISDIVARKSDVLWVDVGNPTPEDARVLAEEFAFHPLAIEDAIRYQQRPKVDLYDDFVFIVFYALRMDDDEVATTQVSLFVGQNYVVTVHTGSVPELDSTRDRWCANAVRLGNRGVGLLVHAILDAIVDGYFPVIDALSDRVEDLEEQIFERGGQEAQRELFRLKKELLEIRRVIAPERDAVNVLLRRDSPVFDDETTAYLQDVYDHILRTVDAVDIYRDLISSALDAYLSVTSNRLNQVMKTLTASSIILMSVTLVASIYGMNFDVIPELHWRLGYAWALGLMIIIGGALFALFRRIDWL